MKPWIYGVAIGAVALSACQNNSADTAANNDVAITNTTDSDTNVTGTAAAGTLDTAFVTEAIQGDNSEVAIGQLATERGSSQATKDFGKLLTTDHGAHKAKLAALANGAGVTVPSDPSAEGNANLEKLRGLSGAEFDRAFKSAMVEDHQKDIAKYEKQASSGDAQTAALARETLPTLRKHLAAAQAL